MYCTGLYSTVQYNTVQYCAVLYCAALYCTVYLTASVVRNLLDSICIRVPGFRQADNKILVMLALRDATEKPAEHLISELGLVTARARGTDGKSLYQVLAVQAGGNTSYLRLKAQARATLLGRHGEKKIPGKGSCGRKYSELATAVDDFEG